MKKIATIIAAGLSLWLSVPSTALAQKFPDKPIKWTVPFPPGGNTDRVARLYALKLSESLGQQVVIDNKAGATGSIGLQAVAKSPADGYSLVIGDLSSLIVNKHANPKLPFDPFTDFTPVAKLAEVSIVITGRADLPANNLAEFLALAKAQPGKFTYATSGVGSIGHLSFELIKSMADVDVRHVAYKGGGPAVTDLIGGHVDVVVDGAALPFVLDGKIKALATTGPRLSVLPKVPSVAESGLKGYGVTNWWCLLAPVGTPAAIVKTLSDEIARIANTAEVKSNFEKAGIAAASNTSAEMSKLMHDDYEKMGGIIKKSKIEF